MTVNGKKKALWKYELDGYAPNASQAAMEAWFDNVTMPVSGSAAPTLTATFAAGTASGATKATITGSAGEGNHYGYKVAASTIATPVVGQAVSGSITYVSGNDITGVEAGQCVALYELTNTNTVVKFVAPTLVSNEIKA